METKKTTKNDTENTAKLEVCLITLQNHSKNLTALTRALTYCSEELNQTAIGCLEVINQELENHNKLLQTIFDEILKSDEV